MRFWFQEQLAVIDVETSEESQALAAWHWGVSQRMLPDARGSYGTWRDFHQIWERVHRHDPDAVLPDGADFRLLTPGAEPRIELRQTGESLRARVIRRGREVRSPSSTRVRIASRSSRWIPSGSTALLPLGPRNGAGIRSARG